MRHAIRIDKVVELERAVDGSQQVRCASVGHVCRPECRVGDFLCNLIESIGGGLVRPD